MSLVLNNRALFVRFSVRASRELLSTNASVYFVRIIPLQLFQARTSGVNQLHVTRGEVTVNSADLLQMPRVRCMQYFCTGIRKRALFKLFRIYFRFFGVFIASEERN